MLRVHQNIFIDKNIKIKLKKYECVNLDVHPINKEGGVQCECQNLYLNQVS